nr:hypothetical protein [Tanacetum cinerariifolium]
MSLDMLTVGSTMRIPLLYRDEYSQWSERFMNYLEEKTDGEAMINSIKNGDQPLPRVTQVSIAETSSTEQPSLKDKSIWFLALGWHLEEIHVTWAHLEKKRTRLRLYTKSLKKLYIQSVETASRVSSNGVRTFEVTTLEIWLLDNDGNPLVSMGIVESDSEVKVRDSYPDNDDYDPYDDDMYENHDLSEHLQSICDDLDITALENQLLSVSVLICLGKRKLLDNDGNPLVSTGIVESDSEVKLVFDETANLRISTSGKDGSDRGYGTNSLLEQWRDSYPDNDDYDPYDDGMYENHDLSGHLQSICDDLDITVRG